MKLIAILRVKNQITTIKPCLARLSKLVDEIVIVDNGSTDGTISAYKQFPIITQIAKTKGFDEGRDKRLCLKLAKARNPDWILWQDADEFIEEFVTRAHLDKLLYSSLNLVNFRLFHFWLSRSKYRVDGLWHKYTAFPQRQMWRNTPSAHFSKARFHTGGIKGIIGKETTSLIRIKHFGYTSKKLITQRTKTYHQLKNHPRSSKTMPLTPIANPNYLRPWSPGYANAMAAHAYWSLAQAAYMLNDKVSN